MLADAGVKHKEDLARRGEGKTIRGKSRQKRQAKGATSNTHLTNTPTMNAMRNGGEIMKSLNAAAAEECALKIRKENRRAKKGEKLYYKILSKHSRSGWIGTEEEPRKKVP